VSDFTNTTFSEAMTFGHNLRRVFTSHFVANLPIPRASVERVATVMERAGLVLLAVADKVHDPKETKTRECILKLREAMDAATDDDYILFNGDALTIITGYQNLVNMTLCALQNELVRVKDMRPVDIEWAKHKLVDVLNKPAVPDER
jgi:hypothetical protein